MASRTEGGIDIGDPLALLPVLCQCHLAFHLLVRNSRAAQVDTGLAADALCGIYLEGFVIFFELSFEKNTRALGDDQGG